MSIKAEIIAHFKANPEAKPIEVGKIFGASNGNVYNYRKEALGIPKKTRKIKKFNTFATMDIKDVSGMSQEALSELAWNLSQGRSIPAPPHHNAWDNFGEWMTTSQYEGYLRGIIIAALTSNRAGLLPEVEDAIKRLRSITGE